MLFVVVLLLMQVAIRPHTTAIGEFVERMLDLWNLADFLAEVGQIMGQMPSNSLENRR